MSIQSILIPATQTRQSPAPHTVYQVRITTGVRSWDVYRRYSDFESLVQELRSETGKDVDGEKIPPKRVWSLKKSINDQKLIEERRVGLESYLRHILSHRNPVWRTSHAFLDFLSAPPLPSANSSHSKANGPDPSATPGSSLAPAPSSITTSPAWLAEHVTLSSLVRTIRSSLSKRDALLQSGNPSGGHIAHIQAKKDLTVLVNRLSTLVVSLDIVAKTERLGDGEIKRRAELLGRLQDECLTLGKAVENARKPPVIGNGFQAGSLSSGATGRQDDLVDGESRRALLGPGPSAVKTVRTLGGAPPGQETEETRPLDGGGLMHLQQTKINQQDSMLTQLSSILQRQRVIGEAIGQEITEQNELLDKLDSEVDVTGAKLGKAKRTMNRLN
ncbi:VAM7 [Phaffia rhodozyma]|uniref:VAM7 n=1 Tax=Phaffia rhodozyma TaxID=264483 RepID=A0A0F7SMU6_PHARH|nr:VAM7 [Phaffia rhodozyma]